MSPYNWPDIFKNKTEQELITIYRGDSLLDFEAEIYAGIELKNRKIDLHKFEKIHQEKIKKLEEDIKEYENLQFYKSRYGRHQGGYFAAFLIFIFYLSTNYKALRQFGGSDYYSIIIYTVLFFLMAVTAKWNFNRYKRNKERTILKKKDLLNQLN